MISSSVSELLLLDEVPTSPPAVMVEFDPMTYSVMEGGSVNIILTADRDFSLPFNVTLTSNSDEGRVRSLGMHACLHSCMLTCTSAQYSWAIYNTCA